MDWQQIFASRMMRMKASEIRELLKLLDQPDIISFAGGIPDPALFPAQAYRSAMAEALSDATAPIALQYSVSEGYRPLRDWIVQEMARSGVTCTADNILITSGSQQALDYLGKLLLSPGDTALVNWPSYMGALGAFNAYEPRYDRLNGNAGPAEFAAAAGAAGGRVKFAYLSADFGNPTGETLDLAGREALIDLADELDIAIIEDNAYQRLRYDGDAVPSILALEIARKGNIENCRTVYCGSFSKSLAPGLRIGWVCAATPAINRLVQVKQAADLHSATLNQVVTAHVAQSVFEDHVAGLRQTYGRRRDLMLAALDRDMPQGVTWTRPQGGMFVWLTLPAQMDGATLLAQALADEKVAFVPGRAFFADGSNGNTIRLSFTLHEADAMNEGIARLGRAIRNYRAG
ncbi:MAG: PLP-dependent aminotransferase family protein [Paracoccus sp. (in: a-proteobacteria)]|uniref:aminotransferase-like domain-containing protein n=1 Tax=Paracoccus sp. TaxID=267 RepID=UPI0026DF7A81|nr:PLP-dependent aminotransferase family protein [Paracoccus sp. (in: a-proteobacteria)]MDO5632066.1 PLP-dependent aminotransferase family protein [Paracoccus sp. (in: a-proteobacteria)]